MDKSKNCEFDYSKDQEHLINYKEELKNWFYKVFSIVEGKEGFETKQEDIPHEWRQDIDYDESPVTWRRETIKFENYEIVYDHYTNEVELYENGDEVDENQERRLDITYDILKMIYGKYNSSNKDNHRLRVTKELAKTFIDPLSWNKENALKLINEGYVDLVAKNLNHYEWLDDEIAEKLVEYGYWWAVFPHKQLFKWLKLDNQKADKMIENWEWWLIISNIEEFEWVKLDKKIAEMVIEQWDWDFVGRYIDRFEWLDKEIADKLIKAWYRYYVDKYPEKFWL